MVCGAHFATQQRLLMLILMYNEPLFDEEVFDENYRDY